MHSDDLFVEIPIPAFAYVESVASSGICQGTTVITCHFFARDPGATDFVEVALRLNQTGTFVSNIRGGARNDTNPANDSVALWITSTAVMAPPSSHPGESVVFGWRRRWRPHRVASARVVRRAGLAPGPDSTRSLTWASDESNRCATIAHGVAAIEHAVC
jgi:hypothetical protein